MCVRETTILASINFAQRVVKVNDLTNITRLQKVNNGTRSDCISVQQHLRSLIMVLHVCTHAHGISTVQYVTIT